jgi:hypothetical protein
MHNTLTQLTKFLERGRLTVPVTAPITSYRRPLNVNPRRCTVNYVPLWVGESRILSGHSEDFPCFEHSRTGCRRPT